MNMNIFYKLSGVFIIIIALGFTISQIGITKLFNYPKILRSETDVILNKYNRGGKLLKFFWTLFAFSSLMLIPLSSIFYKLLNTSKTPYLIIGTFLGIASGIFYTLGLMRWTFLATTLSNKYINADNALKKNIELIFEAFHVYSGNSIGETMGFFCMGTWIAISGFAFLSSAFFPSFIGLALIILGIGILLSPLEWLGLKFANKLNKMCLKLLMVVLIYIGVMLIIR